MGGCWSIWTHDHNWALWKDFGRRPLTSAKLVALQTLSYPSWKKCSPPPRMDPFQGKWDLTDFLVNYYIIPLNSQGKTKTKINDKPWQILVDTNSGTCKWGPGKTVRNHLRVRILTGSNLPGLLWYMIKRRKYLLNPYWGCLLSPRGCSVLPEIFLFGKTENWQDISNNVLKQFC